MTVKKKIVQLALETNLLILNYANIKKSQSNSEPFNKFEIINNFVST